MTLDPALERLVQQWRSDHLGPDKGEGVGLLWKEGGFVELLVALHRTAPRTMAALAEQLATVEPIDTRMRDFLTALGSPETDREDAFEAVDLYLPRQDFADALDGLEPPMAPRFRDRIVDWLEAARGVESALDSGARVLSISAELRRDLLRLRRALGVTGAPEVPTASVDAIVETLRCRVPDEVLATLAALGRTPDAMIGLLDELDEFFAANEQPDWKTLSSFDHVPFLAWGEYPRVYACFGRSDQTIDQIDTKTASFSRDPHTVSAMLRWAWPDVDFEAEATPEGAFVPRIVDVPQTTAVSHPKFGPGTVVEDLGDRAKVKFEDGSERTMLCRFLKI